jgi:hypothetical protein
MSDIFLALAFVNLYCAFLDARVIKYELSVQCGAYSRCNIPLVKFSGIIVININNRVILPQLIMIYCYTLPLAPNSIFTLLYIQLMYHYSYFMALPIVGVAMIRFRVDFVSFSPAFSSSFVSLHLESLLIETCE